jgi:AraC-like DNA-binding protein
MPVEVRDDGALVYGYLDTGHPDRAHASDTVLVRAATPYVAEMRAQRFGGLNSCEVSGEQPVQVLPRAHTVRDDGYLLGLLLAGGGELEQDGRCCRLAPGDLVLYSGRRPFRLDLADTYRWFMIQVDSGLTAALGPRRDLTASEALAHSPSARILASMLAEVALRSKDLGPLARTEMGEHVTGMVRTITRAGARPPQSADRLLAGVLEYIDRHLAEDLSPARIATAHHVSVRTLHVLFQRQGDTVGDHIRRRRLDHIRRDLADPALDHLAAYAVAGRWGIQGPSYLSKVFKAEFGVSPSEFRARRGDRG